MVDRVRVGWAREGVLFLAEGLQELLTWLEAVTGGRVFETGRGHQENPLWFSSRSYHPLSRWLAKELEMAIVRSFLGAPSPYEEVASLAEFLRKTGKSTLIRGLEVGLTEWARKGAEREGVREKLRSAEERLQRAREEELLQSLESRPKKSKRRNKRRAETAAEQQLELILLNRQSLGSDSDSD
jgi:hypothetical protein